MAFKQIKKKQLTFTRVMTKLGQNFVSQKMSINKQSETKHNENVKYHHYMTIFGAIWWFLQDLPIFNLGGNILDVLYVKYF